MSSPANAPAGRIRVATDTLSPWPCRAMLGLLGRDPDGLAEGDPLPLGWHWLYFREPVPASAIASDGHEKRGGFMPRVDLPRRMWAGGTLRSCRPVRIGARAELRSRVRGVKEKMGKSGRLVFVTVGNTVSQNGRRCVEEEQVIVYRGVERGRVADPGRTAAPGQAAEPEPTATEAPPPDTGQGGQRRYAAWTETFLPTPVTLFQFSALTWNAHRIHYDRAWVTEQEGYPDLLVHGPLTALLLLDAAQRHSDEPVTRLRYRALSPLYVNRPITLLQRPEQASIVEALGPDGAIAMRGWLGKPTNVK